MRRLAVATLAVALAAAGAAAAQPAPSATRIDVRGIDSVMALDATQRGQVAVFEGDGTRVTFPRLRWASSDTTVIAVDATGALMARGPGVADVSVATLGAQVVRRVRVDGVAIYVNGERRPYAGDLLPTDRVVITNGLLRLRLGASEFGQRAGTVAEVRVGNEWAAGTSLEFGDYTYVASAVSTAPTRAVALIVNKDVVSVRWVFRDHRFMPAELQLAEVYDDQPYPFEKQVWLRAGELGYYARVRPYEVLPATVVDAEHEIGFGGLWGPGTISTFSQRVQFASADSAGRRIDPRGRLDAAEMLRAGDGLVRVLVPMSPAAFMVPRFSPDRYGSVWIHQLRSESYGAYLYMAPSELALSAREVCTLAYQNPPFMIVAPPTAADLRECGTSRHP